MALLSSTVNSRQYVILITVLSVFAAFSYVGFREFFMNPEDNRCEMTWMYEYPEYLPVPLGKKVTRRFPSYKLYLYGEGEYADSIRRFQMRGIPVLFIPGNAGSYKQVRSLASVALRKAEKSAYHFNYFTVDLAESFSGIAGGFLEEQTFFVRLCISRILKLYSKANYPPKSIVLVGHSMGGLLARAQFALSGFDSSQAHTIITLGSPHQHAVVSLDPYLDSFYENVNSFWSRELYLKNSSFQNVVTVSVSGGANDVLVRSGISSLTGLAKANQTISVVSTAVPRVWVTIDHLCLCWCKQLVLAINRALFDMIDPASRQISENKNLRMQVMRHHFVSHLTPRIASQEHIKDTFRNISVVLIKDDFWKFNTVSRAAKNGKQFYAFPSRTSSQFTVVTNLNTEHWLFGCKKMSGKTCNSLVSLSVYIQLYPVTDSVLKLAVFQPHNFRKFSHFVVYNPNPRDSQVLIWTEFLNSYPASQELKLPWFYAKTKFEIPVHDHPLFLNFTIPSISKAWKVYTFAVTATKCEEENKKIILAARIHVPWFKEDVYFFSNTSEMRILIKLHHPKPKWLQRSVQVHLLTQHECSYTLTGKMDTRQTLGHIFRFYSVQIPAWVYSMLLLVLSWQLSVIVTEGHCPSFFELLSGISKSLRILLLLLQAHFLISQLILSFFVYNEEKGHQSWLPGVHDLRTFDWILPLVFVSFTAALIIIVMFVWGGVLMRLGSIIFGFGTEPVIVKENTKLVIISEICIAMSLTFLSLFVCGVVAVMFAFVLFVIKSCQVEAKLQAFKRISSKTNLQIIKFFSSMCNFYLTVFCIVIFTICMNLATLAVWVKNLHVSYRLRIDPTAYISSILCLNIVRLSFHRLPKIPPSLVYGSFVFGVLVTHAPIVPLYLIPFAVVLVFSAINVLGMMEDVRSWQAVAKPKQQ